MVPRWESAPDLAAAARQWSVVMLASEPAPLILANLAWHLDAGARAVHLYLDNPRDTVANQASALPGVHVTRCDQVFWQSLSGKRPALQTRRQSLVATHAYRSTSTGWMVHLDADEFLWPAGGLAADLAQIPREATWLHLPVLERRFLTPGAQTLFEGTFVPPLQPGAAPSDPARAPFLARGLTAHAAGKGCTRCGLGAELLPHAPRLQGARPSAPDAATTRVLHFDGLTRLHWLLKLLRYADHPQGQWERFLGPHRQAQLRHVRRHRHDADALHAFHDLLKCGQIGEAAAVQRLPFDPSEAMLRLKLPTSGLQSATFDDLLRRSEPALCRGL